MYRKAIPVQLFRTLEKPVLGLMTNGSEHTVQTMLCVAWKRNIKNGLSVEMEHKERIVRGNGTNKKQKQKRIVRGNGT